MTSSSAERVGSVKGKGAGVHAVPARLDMDLAGGGPHPYLRRGGVDPRLLDPRLEEAFAELVEEARAAARAAGYAEGYAEARRAAAAESKAAAERQAAAEEAAAAQRAQRTSRALAAIDRAATELERRAAATATAAEDALATAAFTLVQELLGRELAIAKEPGLDAIRRALALAPSGRPVLIRLHPEDHATVAGSASWTADREITLVADPTIEPGGCVAQCDATDIDAQLGPALARLREVLS